MSDLLQFHQWLLTDRNRTLAYRDAINLAVKKDDVVLDIGTGTGILSFFACLAGARKVYAIEKNDAIALAREICAANGFTDCVEFIQNRSQNITLPEQVDVILSDTGASFGLQGGMLGTLLDARRRFLKPGGRIFPQTVDLFVSPVELEDVRSLDVWGKNRYGVDLSPIRRFAANTNYHMSLDRDNVLAPSQLLATVSFQDVETTYASGETLSVIEKNGVMHGLGGWISVNLVPQVSFSNSPLECSDRIVKWTQSVFPIDTPVPVSVGDHVKSKVSTNNGKQWRWQIEISEGKPGGSGLRVKARFDHSTIGSFPIASKDLKKQNSCYAPRLSRQGEAESFLLGALNGKRTLAELTGDLLAKFPDCFPTQIAASRFARNVVDRCS